VLDVLELVELEPPPQAASVSNPMINIIAFKGFIIDLPFRIIIFLSRSFDVMQGRIQRGENCGS